MITQDIAHAAGLYGPERLTCLFCGRKHFQYASDLMVVCACGAAGVYITNDDRVVGERWVGETQIRRSAEQTMNDLPNTN